MSQWTVIRTKNRRQAMDWSLVLLSQGIEPVVERLPETGWQLRIPASQGPAAFQALRQYQVENRGFRWRQPIPASRLLFHWGVAGWAAWLLAADWLFAGDPVRRAGRVEAARVLEGEWWRLFTAVSLHADLPHLMSNAAMGFVLLGLAMAQVGAGFALLACFLAGAGGNALSLAVHGPLHASLGASGMVLGALGVLSAQGWRVPRASRSLQLVRQGVLAGLLLLALLGLDPQTDVLAHVGGFVTGLALGVWLPTRAGERLGFWNTLAGVAALGLLLATWGLALRRPGGFPPIETPPPGF